ncbi:hypothetical protein [Ekhidna sp.]|uniref:hypothetical protein n=1 Tax=Ekhidna sp. TaxID=2608089 RepID=UPI003CCBB9D7
MKTITLDLSDKDFEKYQFDSDNISFKNFVEKVRNTLAREAMQKCQKIASTSDLSGMTMKEINDEVKAIRDAKNNR